MEDTTTCLYILGDEPLARECLMMQMRGDKTASGRPEVGEGA